MVRPDSAEKRSREVRCCVHEMWFIKDPNAADWRSTWKSYLRNKTETANQTRTQQGNRHEENHAHKQVIKGPSSRNLVQTETRWYYDWITKPKLRQKIHSKAYILVSWNVFCDTIMLFREHSLSFSSYLTLTSVFKLPLHRFCFNLRQTPTQRFNSLRFLVARMFVILD